MPPSRITDHVVEVRFKPNARILDYRGQWAELIAEHLKATEWSVVDNRIDVFDKGDARRFFLAFRNCGATIKDAPTEAFFLDHAIKFFEFVLAFGVIPKPVVVERIGVRLRSFRATEADFDRLLKRYMTRVWPLTPEATEAFGGELVDIGGLLQLQGRRGRLQHADGPDAHRAGKAMDGADESAYPKIGVFMDCDYWMKADAPGKSLAVSEIVNTIRRFAERAARRSDAIFNLLNAPD